MGELIKCSKPAYSISYHKVQGQTFDKPICLNINRLNKKQKNNMLYVGVSRVRKLEQLNLLDKKDFKLLPQPIYEDEFQFDFDIEDEFMFDDDIEDDLMFDDDIDDDFMFED